MKLRRRMALVAVLVAIPQVVGLVWWDARSRHRSAEASLRGMLERAASEEGAAARCRADPQGWVGPDALPPPDQGRFGPGPHAHGEGDERRGHHEGLVPPRLHVYGADGQAHTAGVALPADFAPVGPQVEAVPDGIFQRRVRVALATGWGAPCDVVVVEGSTVPGFLGSVLPTSPVWVVPMALVATVMWMAVAPVVRRLQDLTEAVRTGAPVPGRDHDDELGELARALHSTRAELVAEAEVRRQREQALRDFVADTAHDLRVPLTVLRGHLVALEGLAASPALTSAAAETDYIAALLANLAARSRLEAAPQRTAVDLGALVERTADRHRPLARRAGVAISDGAPPEPVKVSADLTLAEQALSNLVYNAVRHNRPGGHVAVTLDLDGDHFELAVRDDGPGVSAEELGRLTQRAFRGDAARSRGVPGEGRGLAIVAKVAQVHGWTLDLSVPPEGGLLARVVGPLPTAADGDQSL